MEKVGPNKPCPCGSGKKFKKCHGSPAAEQADHLPPGFDAELQRRLREMDAKRLQREKQQGHGKGIISVNHAGHRMVAVGNKLYHSKQWKSFHDFLRAYLVSLLGKEWFKSEQCKPEDQRHPIVCWYDRGMADAKRLSTKVGDIFFGPMTGAQRAFLNLAYNLYLIAHHAPPAEAKGLLDTFLKKLKSERPDDFVGKLFETYAAASFLKAGFTVDYEDEQKGGDSKVEFVATFPKTGKKFSVEVKSRNRAKTEDGPVDDVKRLRVASKLNRALAKNAAHPRVVMIEVNVPDILDGKLLEGWPKAALDQIRQAEMVPPPEGGEKPSAYVIVTNHAFHNNLDAIAPAAQAIAAGCRIPDFGPDVLFGRLKDALESEERHREVLALLDSMRTHYDIPSTFDGDNPELAFRSDEPPPLKFGERYQVPRPDGTEVSGRLYEGIVIESEKRATAVYETDSGEHLIMSVPLTDAELAGWKKHPETFFGEARRQSGRVDNWLELAKWLHENYKNASREKLLEWMKSARDLDELSKLPQTELAMVYCERVAASADRKGHFQKAP